VAPIMLFFTLGGMLAALGFRKAKVQSWVPYVLIGGGLSWYGLITAHLHPALALVFIVPFLPAERPQMGMIAESEDRPGVDPAHGDTPLQRFEHFFKMPVDYGLFLFAFANAGVEFANIGPLTWIVLASLVVGKTLGVFLFSALGSRLGFSLPGGMVMKDLAVAGLVAGLGLTVALFVSGEAYTDPDLQGQAKMGALFSGGVFVLALLVGRLVRIAKVI
jgi:NhaA family Na+:H+ antiporter